jgi:hypothetical protein
MLFALVIGNIVRYSCIKYGVFANNPLLNDPALYSYAISISTFLSRITKTIIDSVFAIFED